MSDQTELGPMLTVCSPATGEVVWRGTTATPTDVENAVKAARQALELWCATSSSERIAIAERFAEIATRRHLELASVISAETGKPMWESIAESKLISSKVRLAVTAYRQRTGQPPLSLPQGMGSIGTRPIGIMAVLGPFNFPAHLPNGHIVPALIAGNVVVFKPSERTPGCGELLASFWREANLPEGVLQIVHGGRNIGSALIDQSIDGVLFTGSHPAGVAIHRQLAGRPEVLLALELGGNNPLVVDNVSDLDAAAMTIVVSAYITAGQRCTCARRLILPDGPHVQPLLAKVQRLAANLVVGAPDAIPEPFMGPIISSAEAARVLARQSEMIQRGGVALLTSRSLAGNPAMLSPGLIDVTEQSDREDSEVFGPLLQVIRVPDFDSAIDVANATRFGLAAGLLSDDMDRFHKFRDRVRAGVLTWNQPTVGASGRLPFGGLAASGNHRPSGFAAAEYCDDAIATLETTSLSMPTLYPGLSPNEITVTP